MEIAIAVLSWIVTILLPLLILSMPVQVAIGHFKKDWKDSKGEKWYKRVQLIGLGVFALCLMIVIVLMTGTF